MAHLNRSQGVNSSVNKGKQRIGRHIVFLNGGEHLVCFDSSIGSPML